jgi:hypothetical protein
MAVAANILARRLGTDQNCVHLHLFNIGYV